MGGICGENNLALQYCCVTANVQNDDDAVGGIVGENNHIISHCTFYGTVTSAHSQDNKYAGNSGTENTCYDTFQQSEYDADGSMGMYRQAIKYPYTVTVKTVGQGTIQTQVGGEYDVPGAQASTTFTLNVTSGTVQSVNITDADGNNVSLQGQANDNSSYWFVMPKREVFVTVQFWGNWPKQGTGTVDDPYLITSADDWNNFANNVTLGRSYSGEYVKLNNNISVTTMAGDDEDKSFQGTFDGDGKTLTLNLNERDRAIAPFRYVKNATIKNLKTAGSVTGNYTGNSVFPEAMDLSGIVGWANGTTTIQNCVSSVAITSNRPGDVDAGGIVAHVDEDQTINMKGCVFNGSITYSNANGYEGGGLIGWLRTDANATVKDCLFAPSAINISDPSSHYTLAGGTSAAVTAATIENSYYTRPLGTEQGSMAIFTTYAPSALGSLVEDYGMVKAYQNGLLFDGKYYFAPTLGTGSGTEGDPYIMSNASQWDTFVYDVDNYDNYNGKFILLTADISVSTMVGSSEERSFQSTFLGNNHTLTFTKGSAETPFGEENCAPFRFTKNATIQDLKVAGDIYTSQKLAAGLASRPYGTTTITNCRVSTVIHSSKNGDGAHGGIVAMPGASGTLRIEGCAYTGRLLTNNGTNNCGGFVGESHGALTIANCRSSVAINSSKGGDGTHGGFAATLSGANNIILFDGCVFDGSFATTNGTIGCGGFIGWPVYNSPYIINSLMKPSSVDTGMLGGTFSRVYYEPTIYNCYFVPTTNLPDDQGAQADAYATAPASLGRLETGYSMMTVYENCILFDGTYYMAPAITLADNADNSTTISSNNGKVVDVTLADRTLYKDGAWNTLCLPFDVYLDYSPLAGATARRLSAGSIDGSTLNLTFGDPVSTLLAGTPYIIKWPASVSFTYTATSGTGTGDGGYDKLLDGNTNTKWCQENGPWTCEFNTSVPVFVTGYTLTTGGDTYTYQSRNPRKWTLEAKATSSDDWTVIGSRDVTTNSGDALPTANTTESQVYAIAGENLGAYQYFRFKVSQIGGGSWMQLSELTLQQGSDIENPVFSGVTIDATEHSYDNNASGDARVRFVGTYKSTTFDDTDKSILFLGASNTLYYPQPNGDDKPTIGAQRAYFKIGDGAAARQLTAFNINFGDEDSTQGVTTPLVNRRGTGDEAWFTIDGRRLDGKPSRAGVYINNGVKVVIK